MSEKLFRGAAYHEAGHIVVAWHFGALVGRAWINDETDLGQGGCCLDASRLPPLDHVVICWAGIVAQEDFRARTFDSAGDCDLKRARSLLAHLRAEEADAAMNDGKIAAQNILRTRAEQVHRLAAALSENKRLTAEEVASFREP